MRRRHERCRQIGCFLVDRVSARGRRGDLHRGSQPRRCHDDFCQCLNHRSRTNMVRKRGTSRHKMRTGQQVGSSGNRNRV